MDLNFDKLFKVTLILIKNLFSKIYYDFLNHFRGLFTNFNFYFVRFDLFLFLKLYLLKSVFLFFWRYKDHNHFDFSLLKILNDLAKNWNMNFFIYLSRYLFIRFFNHLLLIILVFIKDLLLKLLPFVISIDLYFDN